MLLLRVLLAIHTIDPAAQAGESLDFTSPCTLQVEADTGSYLILPVRAAHWNLHRNQGEHGLGTDTLSFSTTQLQGTTLVFPSPEGILPDAGTFYLSTSDALAGRDTLRILEPPHRDIPFTVQISIRPDDTYLGYLHELLNTPFIMAPRATPDGCNQSDARLGTDCAGLAVYGRRRMGCTNVRYLGPRGILQYLDPITDQEYRNTGGIYISQQGDTARAPERGDILHFGEQVSIFLEDRGEQNTLDTEDLVIQSWFDGPHICEIGDNGFTDHPLRLYRWKEAAED